MTQTVSSHSTIIAVMFHITWHQKLAGRQFGYCEDVSIGYFGICLYSMYLYEYCIVNGKRTLVHPYYYFIITVNFTQCEDVMGFSFCKNDYIPQRDGLNFFQLNLPFEDLLNLSLLWTLLYFLPTNQVEELGCQDQVPLGSLRVLSENTEKIP